MTSKKGAAKAAPVEEKPVEAGIVEGVNTSEEIPASLVAAAKRRMGEVEQLLREKWAAGPKVRMQIGGKEPVVVTINGVRTEYQPGMTHDVPEKHVVHIENFFRRQVPIKERRS